MPSCLPAYWENRGVGGGGSLYSPQISPYNPAEMYISSDMGQLFHSTTGGVSWQVVDFRSIKGNTQTRVVFTEDPAVLYTLGDGFTPFKSTDGGGTWQPLPGYRGDTAYTLFADPADHNRVLVASADNLYFSGDGGASFAPKYPAADLHAGGAFFDGPNIYVGTNRGLLVSEDGGTTFTRRAVGGIRAGEAILSFAGAKQGGVTRFFAVTQDAAHVYPGIQGREHFDPEGIYSLDWGQPAWTPRDDRETGIDLTRVKPFFVGMALNDINVAYVAGLDTSVAPAVYKTSDGGGSWQNVFQTFLDPDHVNVNIVTGWAGYGGDTGWGFGGSALGFAVAPNDPNRAVITDAGFAHATTDGGRLWRQLYVDPADEHRPGQSTPPRQNYHSSGLDNSAAWQVHWTDPTHLIVANTDFNLTLSADGGRSFNFNYTGLNLNTAYRVITHPANGVIYAATSSIHDLYMSNRLTDADINGGDGAVRFSTDLGTTWQALPSIGHPVVWVADDPTRPNRLYAGVVHGGQTDFAGDIYVTDDLQDGPTLTWVRLATPPRTQGHPFNIVVLADGTLVVTYSARFDGGFTPSSGVFVSTDGGATWSDRSYEDMARHESMRYWTKDIVVDPSDPSQNTWYACVFSIWGRLGGENDMGGLYRTTDRGLTWTRITDINQIRSVESVTFDPTDPNGLFLTTETQGLWHSNNIRSAIPAFVQVGNYPFMHPDRVFFNPFDSGEVWVTSYGSGLWVGTVCGNPPVSSLTDSFGGEQFDPSLGAVSGRNGGTAAFGSGPYGRARYANLNAPPAGPTGADFPPLVGELAPPSWAPGLPVTWTPAVVRAPVPAMPSPAPESFAPMRREDRSGIPLGTRPFTRKWPDHGRSDQAGIDLSLLDEVFARFADG